MPTIRVGVQANSTSTGQIVDIDAGRANVSLLANASAESIQYSTNSGTTWTTVAAGASVTVGDVTADGFRVRRLNVGGYPLPIDVTFSPANSVISGTDAEQAAFPSLVSRDGIAVLNSGGTPIATAVLAAYPQIPIASFGDSIAKISGFSGHDISRVPSADIGFYQERMAPHVNGALGGTLRFVANCGIDGETTAQMLARDGAGSTSSRKALTDAKALGARYLIFSAGINDLQTLAANATSGQIDATVNSTLANVKALCRRAIAMGMVPIFPCLLGYRYQAGSGLQTADAGVVAVVQEAIRRFNARAEVAFESAGGKLGYWIDGFYPQIVDSSGAWLPGMDNGDGLHPGGNGCAIIYRYAAQAIAFLEGCAGTSPYAYPISLTNLITNADFAASAAGLATGVSVFDAQGTATKVNALVEVDGQLWQEVTVTPTALNGSSNYAVQMDIAIPVSTIASGDLVGGEFTYSIDTPSGGPASSVFQYCARCILNTNYGDLPAFNPNISPKIGLATVINRRAAILPVTAPGAAPAGSTLSLIVFANSLAPFRIRVTRPRAVKLPAGY